ALVVIGAVTLLWPLNVPLAALAYKIRLGRGPNPLEDEGFWWRCTFAALGLAGLSAVTLGLIYLLDKGAELPPGLVHLLVFLAYVPVAAWYLFWMFAMDDIWQSLNLFLVYILLPAGPIWLIGRMTGSWHKLAHLWPWMLPL